MARLFREFRFRFKSNALNFMCTRASEYFFRTSDEVQFSAQFLVFFQVCFFVLSSLLSLQTLSAPELFIRCNSDVTDCVVFLSNGLVVKHVLLNGHLIQKNKQTNQKINNFQLMASLNNCVELWLQHSTVSKFFALTITSDQMCVFAFLPFERKTKKNSGNSNNND